MKEPNATKMFAFNLEQLAVLHNALRTEIWKVQEEIDRREEFDEKNPKLARAVRDAQPKPSAHDRELLAIYLKVNGALQGPFNLSGEPDWVNEVMAQTFLAAQRPKPAPVPQPKVAAKGRRAPRGKTSAANALARSERARQGGLARARKAAAAKAAQAPPGPPAPSVPSVEQVG